MHQPFHLGELKSVCPEATKELATCLELTQAATKRLIEELTSAAFAVLRERRDFAESDRLIGFSRAVNDVERALQGIAARIEGLQQSNEPAPPGRSYPVTHDFTHCKPAGFILKGAGFVSADLWNEMVVAICSALYARDKDLFMKAVSSRGFDCWFGSEPQKMSKPSLVGGGIHINTRASANGLMHMLGKLLPKCGLSVSDVQIYLRDDA